MLEGYFIQYKFVVPDSMKLSSYTYQKIFRAIYGYTQNVKKSNGKRYHYYRHGLLTDVPYIRPGKNCVIIPKEILSKVVEFFKTGKNPTHKWITKGEWKAVYYIDDKKIEESLAAKAFEALINRLSFSEDHIPLINAIKGEVDISKNKEELLHLCRKVTQWNWYQFCYQYSEILKKFHSFYSQLKSSLSP